MPTFEYDGVRLIYEVRGDGPPVLLLAPGGLAGSRIDYWDKAPWNPITELAGRFQVVAMDQRNTGTSWGPIDTQRGWEEYAADQLALMDHLGIGRFSVLGMCIGGAFIARLLADAPARIVAAVALQPIGAADNEAAFADLFTGWRRDIQDAHPEAGEGDWERLRARLFPPGRTLWSVPDDFLPSVRTPLLVLQGNDVYHPAAASVALASRVPGARLIERWKEPEDQPAARAAVADFLAAHAAPAA